MENKIIKDGNNVSCVCVNTKIINKGNPSFLLELESLETGQCFIKFLTIDKTKKGFYTVKNNSYFAKLYRLSIGYVSNNRYSKCDQLLRHFDGVEFFVNSYTYAKDKNEIIYSKALLIKPVSPIYDYRWTKSGVLLSKKSCEIARKNQALNCNNSGINTEGSRKETGMSLHETGMNQESSWNDFAPNWNDTGNNLEWEDCTELPEILGVEHDLNSYIPSPIPTRNIQHTTYNLEGVTDSEKKEGEGTEKYHERIIDETFTLDGE